MTKAFHLAVETNTTTDSDGKGYDILPEGVFASRNAFFFYPTKRKKITALLFMGVSSKNR